MSQTDNRLGSTISNASENDSVAVWAIHLGLRRGKLRKITGKWEKVRWGTLWITEQSARLTAPREGDYSSEGSVKEAFQGWVSLDTQEQSRAGLN